MGFFSELECDCCGNRGELSRCWVSGIETFACEVCRGERLQHDSGPLGPRNHHGRDDGYDDGPLRR